MFGKKNRAIELIKYEGPQDVLVWKHDSEDFNTKTQLVVHESQEAIFLRDGQALDTFPAGSYTLETKNIPLLQRLLNLGSGVTPFHCEVYYINKAVSMGIDWGTDSPIELVDPEYGLAVRLTAYGQFALTVADSRRMLVRLVGTQRGYTQEEIKRYFSEIMAMHIRDAIANAIVQNQIGTLHINTQLVALAGRIQTALAPTFAQYGMSLSEFSVSNIKVYGLEEVVQVVKKTKIDTIAETGKINIDLMKAGAEAQTIQVKGKAVNAVKLDRGLTEAQINQAKGVSEIENKALEFVNTLARNPGAGTSAVDPMTGLPVGNNAAAVAGDVLKTMLGAQGGTAAPGPMGAPAMPVMPVSPAPAVAPAGDARAARKARLQELKELLEDGLITDEEYQAQRQRILESI